MVHDHTSILATIEAKWNLPALSNRDANAATVMDFLAPEPALRHCSPPIQGPSQDGPSGPASVARLSAGGPAANLIAAT